MNNSVSVIFLCHNNFDIDICINSVISQLKSTDEIIVVDDHSNSNTLNKLKKFESEKIIKLILSDMKGNRSRNRNLGAKRAKNPILIFLDGDMVLDDYAISAFKYSHQYKHQRAFVGQKHGTHYDEIQFPLYTGIVNYKELLKTKTGRAQIKNHPLIKDKRHNILRSNTNSKYNWTFYYTGFCSVDKDLFELVDGFDENFKTWGSEDVDFGYRISKLCEIGFIENAHAFHIPHPRNVLKNELTNRKNIFHMHNKYKTWEFEILCGFYGYGNLQQFETVINQMRLLNLKNEEPKITNNDIFIDSVSNSNPNGLIKYTLNNSITENNALGVALNFPSKTFECAYISDHIFIYPKMLCTRIIQEALRHSNKVYIYPTTDLIRIDWDENLLKPIAQKQTHYLEINKIISYIFKSVENSDLIEVQHTCLEDFKNNIYAEDIY